MAGKPLGEIAEEFARDTLSLTTGQLAEKYDKSKTTIKEWRIYCRDVLGLEVGFGHIKYINRKNTRGLTGRQLFGIMKLTAGALKEDMPQQDELSLRIREDLPVGLAFVGDLQVGVEGVDYEQMEKDLNLLGRTPGIYGIGMGDYAHNPKINMGGRSQNLYHMVLPGAREQYKTAEWLLSHIDNWLALIIGCHDDWSHQVDDWDPVEDLCEALDTAHLWHGGIIHLRLGDQKYDTKYDVVARHKFKFESSLNVTNALRQMFDQLYPGDIMALAHKHFPALEKLPRWSGRKDVVYVRSGTYFQLDEYGQKLAGYKGIEGIPIVIIFPDEKRSVPFYGKDLEVAIRTLNNEREHYGAKL